MRVLVFLMIACFLPRLSAQAPPPLPAGVQQVVSTNAPLRPGRANVAPPAAAEYVPFPRPNVQSAPVLPVQRPAGAVQAAPRVSPRPQNPYTALNNQRPEPAEPEALKWDAVAKDQVLKAGEGSVDFTFAFTNVSSEEIVINWVRTSCGCTVAKDLPPTPWHIPPGGNGAISVTMDLRGKVGVVSKMVTVDTSKGPKYLTVRGTIPNNVALGGMDSRTRNMELAKVDRQIVFRNDCASCHAKPAEGKHGEALYSAACAICHDSPHRATMVPDLRALKIPTTPAYWKQWVEQGRAGSLMPAFDKKHGGILDEAQITSLVEYLSKNFKGQPAPVATEATSAPQKASAP